MSDSKVIMDAKPGYSMDTCSDTEPIKDVDTDDLKENRDFWTWMSEDPDSEDHDGSPTFQGKYLSMTEFETVDTSTDDDSFTKMKISVRPSESKKRQLIKKISNMKVECDVACDHSSCFQGIYQTKSLIAKGGFGNVYKVKDPQLIYTFCMKSIQLDPNEGQQKSEHIEFNVQNYYQVLFHKRIVQFFGMVNMGKTMFNFMEYVEGISLDKQIHKRPLPHNKVIQYSKEILEGLKFLHENKIIHRDIKPQNIILDTEEHVKLCDFGLSCYLETIVQGSEIHSIDFSGEMKFCGTPNYMAPELVIGQKYSYPVDIWALGASVVEMLTGLQPFHGMDNIAVIFNIGTKKKIEFVPAEPMSQDMKSFLNQMLCSTPSNRATAENLLRFVEERFSDVDSS